ncbi:MAG TPA: dihydrolipoyl dehydrogenase [Thermoanaerobaculia bacterium]|nr:dihydrolipoyl dehydrogenase [Thermoanaerobaculia bacterium]
MPESSFDLVIIGSGPGGYVAAIRAGQLGLKTAVVEKDDRLGGTCLLRGCIPTKALLHTADLLDRVREAGEQGIEVGEPRLDIHRAMDRKDEVVAKNARGVEYLFKKNGVERIHGKGRLAGPHEVEVEGPDGGRTTYRAEHVLIATGSVPREIPPAPTDGEAILNSDHVLEMREVPESMIVLGAGAVGTEFASIFRTFGTEITLVEMLPRVLPLEDEEVSKEVARALRKRGMKLETGTKLASAERTETGVRVTVEGADGGEGKTLEASKLLVAVGRAPVSRELGFEEAGVEIDERGYIRVDEYCRTSVPQVYAIGDVIDTPWLAHVASHEGILAVEHMAGKTVRPIDYDLTPVVTFCEPEVAHVGLTEAEAKERGYDVAVGKFPFTALGKAVIEGKTTGFVKIVRETKYDQVLGVHIVGVHATDLIAEATLATVWEALPEELAAITHAHPTLYEALGEAFQSAAGLPRHA